MEAAVRASRARRRWPRRSASTEELGGAIAGIAEAELAAGRTEAARTILEGLVVTNPRDARGWILLARTHRSLGQPLAARFCAEVAGILAPESPAAQLARAEGLLPFPEDRARGLELLRAAGRTGRGRWRSGRRRSGPRPAP